MSAAAAAVEPFTYESTLLGRRIRLLRINRNPDTGRLRVSLYEENIDGQTQFLALSYVWGNPNVTQEVIYDGKSLIVTENLHAALWQMRKVGRQGYTWVDAVCINQANTVEKTGQVRMVADIYERAEMVLVWLGTEEDNARLGYDLMVNFCDKIRELELASSGKRLVLTCLECDQNGSEDGVATLNLLLRPWFWRAWVVQEYHLAQKKVFQCGGLVMAPEYLFKIVEILNKHTEARSMAQFHHTHL